jgi:Protein of unknown function (DUF3618)
VSSEQNKSPEQIQAEIEATRSEMGDTVSTVAEKADVKQQAKDKAGEIKDKASTRVEQLTGKAKEAAPDSAGAGMEQAQSVARENPLPLALAGAFIGGVVIGRMTRR